MYRTGGRSLLCIPCSRHPRSTASQTFSVRVLGLGVAYRADAITPQVPSNFYYGDDDRYSLVTHNGSRPWHAKESKLFWRGKTVRSASQASSKLATEALTARPEVAIPRRMSFISLRYSATTEGLTLLRRHQLQYQRHRFVRIAQSLSRSAQSLLLPSPDGTMLTHVKRAVGDLNRAWLDVGFTGLVGCGGAPLVARGCDRLLTQHAADPDICDITDSMYPLKESVPLRDMANYKAILDLVGASHHRLQPRS